VACSEVADLAADLATAGVPGCGRRGCFRSRGGIGKRTDGFGRDVPAAVVLTAAQLFMASAVCGVGPVVLSHRA